MNYERIFLFKKLILIIIKVRMMGYWKSIIILNENKKPSGKFLGVWPKINADLHFLRNFKKCTYENLNWKFIFTQFLSDFPGPLSVNTALENNTIFLQHLFGLGEAPKPKMLVWGRPWSFFTFHFSPYPSHTTLNGCLPYETLLWVSNSFSLEFFRRIFSYRMHSTHN